MSFGKSGWVYKLNLMAKIVIIKEFSQNFDKIG